MSATTACRTPIFRANHASPGIISSKPIFASPLALLVPILSPPTSAKPSDYFIFGVQAIFSMSPPRPRRSHHRRFRMFASSSTSPLEFWPHPDRPNLAALHHWAI
eukprot:scaffold293151_cov27-Prasinocladus_malaysianus.AAC.2